MTPQLFNYGLAFLEGFALILSPCILPILPIILSGTIEGGKKRPLGVICGFVITFALFTLFSRALVQHLGVNLDLVRQFAFGLIIIFGIIMVSDFLSEKFTLLTQGIANTGARFSGNKNKEGFFSGVILGTFISLIWVPCGGPILAAAIVQTAVQQTTLQSFLTFFAFALGSVIPMILIALLGRKIIGSVTFLKTHSRLLRKIFGVIIILAAALAATGRVSAEYVTMAQAPNVVVQPESVTGVHNDKLIKGLSNPYPAPVLQGNSVWINAEPLTIAGLKGKVVLIDFWTYSCINCIRTLPYLKELYEKYKKEGLVIIGVHTPEFEFEKDSSNVKQAVIKLGITYPVALDNDYATWTNYSNQYWPADFLIDKNGEVVYRHFGEGDYEELENDIRFLLGLNATTAPSQMKPAERESEQQTPETYFGYARTQNFAGAPNGIHNEVADYVFPDGLTKDQWALQGKWLVEAEKITAAGGEAILRINYFAGKVYIVAGSSKNNPVTFKVSLNGQPLGVKAGKDVHNNVVQVKEHRLYEIVNAKQATSGLLEISTDSPGLELYTFTFGG